MLCEICNKYKAVIKSYRNLDGSVGSFHNCIFCHNLKNKYFLKVWNEGIDPKEIMICRKDKNCEKCEHKLKCLTDERYIANDKV